MLKCLARRFAHKQRAEREQCDAWIHRSIAKAGGEYDPRWTVNTWIYRQGLQSGQYDLAAAAGLFNAFVAFFLVMTANTLSRRFSRTSLW